ncbi:MAG: cysteine dioxygenase [Burkholderiaceae bacterium]
MNQSERASARDQAVAETVATIRQIESEFGTTRESLEKIKAELIGLAAQSALFPVEDFPPASAGATRNNVLFRLSEDPDHRFALYAQFCQGGTRTPAHDHTTWAVIVGLQGQELNRLYAHNDQGGVSETGQVVVQPGSGIAFMPEDLHSIHIEPEATVLNFHMYGLALEQLHERRFYKESTREWLHFPASSGIREMPVPA